jgi:propionyl-CoA carboxylase alpha chain
MTREKILIANRGEIACRVIKTARKMGLATVAVYSEADANSLHVQMADEAVLLGGPLASDSYLNIEKIVLAIRKTGAKYVHPGYGFLSENTAFAQALEKEGVIFVGPPIKALQKMGDKIESKKLAKKASVNVIPGYTDVIKDANEAKKIAKRIGFPVMIKASAGGGGKGMRVVTKKEEIKDAFESATNEAKNSFGDGRVFLEKYIENPRHIEIQVIGDKYGNIVCLGERECSIQRNHQKVIEECPSPFLDERTRKKMYAQAVSLCKKVGYYSAGTIECMMDKDRNFYFLEMNTRLQVEHPVTELVTGYDIVELMINIAMGKELPFKQKDITLTGWAMESRIYAEDPARGFLPSSGRISKYIEPIEVDNVRVDTGVYEGCEISMFYDAMIAKLCTYGKDRKEALRNMKQALGSFYIDGISHNINFLEKIMHNERFQKGDISTNFIKQEFSNGGLAGNELESKEKGVLIGVSAFMFIKDLKRFYNITGQIQNRDRKVNEKWIISLDNKKYLCYITENYDIISVEYGDGYVSVESSWQHGDNIFRGIVNGNKINVKINSNDYTGSYQLQYIGSNISVTIRSTRVSELEKYMPKIDLNAKPKFLKAPITGKIIKFKVKEGDEIKIGAELISIEAMKMENIIRSDFNVKIKKINFKDGDFVGVGETVIEFEQ